MGEELYPIWNYNDTVYTHEKPTGRTPFYISVDEHGVFVISPSDIDVEKILHKKAVWTVKQLLDSNDNQFTIS
ncbi:hypothetical protein ABES23_11370 [Peribacillus frigoritolerans]|uniref:hypothetical protein n=1 Tax=Peribacillus frigoritolerans TaxID=450367 RepID=UPI003515FE69